LSWTATKWAKTTRGHKGRSEKLVLFVLADYYDDVKGYAWPSHATLSDDCEMPVRTVQWALKRLQEDGFVIRLQKGNQFQPSKWSLNMESEPAIPSIVNPQYGAGEPATSATVNPQPVAGSSDQATLSLIPSEVPLDVPPHTPPLNSPPTSPDPSPPVYSWVEIFERDPRWSPRKGYVEDVEALYPDLDLHAQAVHAYEWLLESSEGQKRKQLGRFFLNWLKRASEDTQPSTNGTKPKPMTQHEKILADKKRWDNV
jgi:hypothetical protein